MTKWTVLLLSAAMPILIAMPSAPVPSDGLRKAPPPQSLSAAAAASPGVFRFSDHDRKGRPVRWPSCRPIDLVVNFAGAPATAERDLNSALREVTKASGLQLHLRGRTAVRPASRGWPYGLMAGPTGWPPVLIAWTAPGTPGLPDDGSAAVTTTVTMETAAGDPVLVAGELVVNRRKNQLFSGRDGLGKILFEHELGHLLGLDHVNDPHEVMYPWVRSLPGLGRGDVRGLRLAGQGGCGRPLAP
jgi:hypothetical protein